MDAVPYSGLHAQDTGELTASPPRLLQTQRRLKIQS